MEQFVVQYVCDYLQDLGYIKSTGYDLLLLRLHAIPSSI